MSGTVIKDGAGSGNVAKVSCNRLSTTSVSETRSEFASSNGNKYNVNTGDITLTTACTSGVLYLKNTSINTIIINSLVYNIGNAYDACCSVITNQDILVDVVKNPTTGTLISNATCVDINVNLNFTSSKELTALIYKGVEGATITDGTDAVLSRFNSVGRKLIHINNIVLQQGASLAVRVKPPTGNASMKVQIALSLYEDLLSV